MATIVGAVAASHTPTIGFAHDASKQTDPVWAPIFDAFEPSRQWLAEQKPDALVVVYNDHISSFFLDHYSSFALGVGERWEVCENNRYKGQCMVLRPGQYPSLASMGLTVSDAIRVFLTRVVADKELPFALKAPNATSRVAIAEANEIIKSRRARFATADSLLNDLEEASRK